MSPRILLDTHILVRWLADPARLSRSQLRMLREALRRHEPFAISAITLLELALLVGQGSFKIRLTLDEVFREVEENPVWRLLPLTCEIAREVASLGPSLRDPADRVIVATARVHGLRLMTSDQRIIESAVVSVVE